MGSLVRPLWNLLWVRTLKSLTSSSVDMSRRATKSTPLKLNFLNVLFFGCPVATLASTFACKCNQRTHTSENTQKKGTKREWWWWCEYEWGYAHHGWKMKSVPKPFLRWGWWCKVLLPTARILQNKKKAGRVSEEGGTRVGEGKRDKSEFLGEKSSFLFFVLKIKCYSTLYLSYTNPP